MDEINKYMSDETVDEVINKFEATVDFVLPAILPIIISGISLLSISIFLGIYNDSLILGILFFICMIPLMIFGVGALSFGLAMSKSIDSINFLMQTTINISLAVYIDKKVYENKELNHKTIFKYSFDNFLLPILRTSVKRKFGGALVIKIIDVVMNKTLNKFSRNNTNDIFENLDKDIISHENYDESISTKSDILINNMKKINTITLTTVTSVRVISICASIFLSIISIFLIIILFNLHELLNF